MRSTFAIICAVMLWTLSGCATRFGNKDLPPSAEPASSTAQPVAITSTGTAPTNQPAKPTVRVLPPLDREPLVRVFLAQESTVSLTLHSEGQIADGRRIPSGTHRVSVIGGAMQIAGTALPAECPITMPEAAKRFTVTLDPPHGKPQTLSFAGVPVLRLVGTQVQVLEEVTLERYLAGVLPVEMTPTWPVEALAAQAIAARSYAAAKYFERFDRPWQLHWHFSVDMAYAGVSARQTANVREALSQTRGQVLVASNLPVPALFHACSGGATEAAANVWPNLVGGDRRTPMTAQMPSIADAAAEAGCRGLKLTSSHWRWKNDLPVIDVSRRLQAYARANPEKKLEFGAVSSVEVQSRHVDSGRVDHVLIAHRFDGKLRRTIMEAQDFRMACDPGEVRSTWWDRCLVVPGKNNKSQVLVLAGRGFGHGVGLSQVSAWRLASTGSDAASIVQIFYPQASLQTKW